MANGRPLVSIVTPVYNHEKFIRACIRSVQKQTYRNWEQIVVDDGSTDQTGSIVQSIGDPRIQYVRRDHLGIEALGELYNLALAKCKGEFVAILEGDDVWHPSKLQLQMSSLRASDVVSYGKCGYIDEKGNEFRVRVRYLSDEFVRDNTPVGSILPYLLIGIPIPAVTLIFRKAELEAIGGFVQPRGIPVVDFPTLIEMSTRGTFKFIDEKLGWWRRYRGQVTLDYTEEITQGVKHFALQKAMELAERGYLSNSFLMELRYKKESQTSEQLAFIRGRKYLLEGRWDEARTVFLSLLKTRRKKILFGSLFGLAGSVFRFHIESCLRLVGKGLPY
jgi:glycosyltransferase involved in cell wall biosynthesis